jgi:hypothetical protein
MEQQVGLAHGRLFAGATILGPALLLGSSVAFAAGGGLNKDELGGALLVYAFVAMTVVAIGIARAVERAYPAPRRRSWRSRSSDARAASDSGSTASTPRCPEGPVWRTPTARQPGSRSSSPERSFP